jgi:hypothetical protein
MVGYRMIIAATIALALSSCSSHETVKNADAEAGVERVFNASFENTQRAALEGLARLKLSPSAIDTVPEGTAIYVARPPHGFSWGEVGRIVVVKGDAPPTTVRVVYQTRMALQFAGSQSGFARNLFAKMDVALANAAN